MMGERRVDQTALYYELSLEGHVPASLVDLIHISPVPGAGIFHIFHPGGAQLQAGRRRSE